MSSSCLTIRDGISNDGGDTSIRRRIPVLLTHTHM